MYRCTLENLCTVKQCLIHFFKENADYRGFERKAKNFRKLSIIERHLIRKARGYNFHTQKVKKKGFSLSENELWKPKFSNFLCISYLCCPSKLFFFCFLRAKMMRLLLMRSFLCCLSPPPLKAALAASSLLACMVSPIPTVVVASSHLCKGLVAPFPFH